MHGMAPSLVWVAAIQAVERKQDLADLAPKSDFISAEAVKYIVGQIGATHKAARDLSGAIDSRSDRLRDGAEHGRW
jgi:hypothetical protein